MSDVQVSQKNNEFAPEAALLASASDDGMVYFDVNGKLLKFPESEDNDLSPTFEASTAYTKGKFTDPREIRSLDSIGHTRKKNVFHAYKSGWYTNYSNDAGFIVAPQFYKSTRDYENFPKRPRESQLLLAGNGIWPVPQAPRRPLPEEQRGIEYLTNSVFVRGLHVDPAELRSSMKEKYWSKESKKNPPEEGHTTFLRRMASSFIGGSLHKGGVWLPKGEFFNDEMRLEDGEAARKHWDAALNPIFMKP